MKILDGKAVAASLREKIKERVKTEFLNNKAPTLAVILVGDDSASQIYVRNKEKACKEVGINSITIRMSGLSTQDEVINKVEELNKNPDVNAILVQLPLPKHIDSKKVIDAIDDSKDVDALSERSMGKLVIGSNIIAPCTPSGIVELLKYYNISFESKHVVVVGRSMLVGRSVELLANRLNATTTICHSRTKNLAKFTRSADILIVAIGKANFITRDMVKRGTVIVDVGMNRVDGKLYGDVDFENVKDKCKFITPVPGGVGPMTIACLLLNTLKLAEQNI